MSIQQSQVEQALEILGEGTRLDVLGEHADLLRYAESQITAQHSERRLRVRVRTTRAGRTVAGSLETLDPGAVRTLATRLDAALADLPAQSTAASRAARETPRDERSGAGSQHEAEGAAADAAASASPAELGGEAPQVVPAASVLDGDPALRHRWFAAVRDGLDSATTLGGAIRFDVLDRVVADSDGLFRAETLTKAAIQAIAKKGDNSVSVRYMHRDADQVPVGEIAGKLRAALTPLPTKEAHHGPCRVLLKPQAVITLIATYGHFVLGATGYATGRSAVAGRLGERVVSDLINLVDDGADAAGLPSGFDAEGNVRRRTQLIENGVLTGVVSDRRRAAVTGGVPTGHAVPDGWRFGGDPSPSNLLLAPGGATDEQLLEECGSGLVVNRLDYLRSLHPKQTLVTGTTRDGTYWADGGEVVAWHPQVRFTFRMDDVLNAVLAVGNTRECGDTTFMDSVVVPSLLIDAGPLVLP